jgi:DNA-binding beta-propeller fold protein YncE
MTTKTTANSTFSYSHTIGFLANQGRGFNNPVDVAMDSHGVIYVLNRGGPELDVRLHYKRVTMCTVDEEYLGEFATGGTGDGGLWWPSALAFDSEDHLYIADEALQRVCVFSNKGDLLDQWGTPGSKDGQLDRPSAMAFDAEDNVYVADSLNHRVQKFTKDGEFLAKWGEQGDGPGQLNMPWGIALDRNGDVYVSDWRNDRVQKFDPTGRYLAQWGGPGDSEGRFNRPSGLTVDEDGNIYVCDWGNERVQVMSPSGETLACFRGDSVVSTWSKDYFEANPDEGAARLQSNLEPDVHPPRVRSREESANIEKLLWGPTAVKLDAQGRIYIVDSLRHRLQVYRRGL